MLSLRDAVRPAILAFVLSIAAFAPAHAAGDAAPPIEPLQLVPTVEPSHSAVPEIAAVAGVALIGLSDHWMWQHATGAGGRGAERLADFARPLGTPSSLAPPLVLGFAAGTLFHRPELAHASVRMAGAIGFAGLTTEALKFVVGRSRPFQVLNGDSDDMRLFSGGTSFPSGHTTIAFAAAAALDRETGARWVPWVAYPLAGLVGWSRLHDEKHWMSDVAAGAAVGYFAANHAENFMRSNDGMARRFAPLVEAGRGVLIGARFRF